MRPIAILKYAVLFIGILILVQILFYNRGVTAQIARVKQANASLDASLATLDDQQRRLLARLESVEEQLPEALGRIPNIFLKGHADPEQQLVAFLDHLSSPTFRQSGISIQVKKEKRQINNPFPLYEVDIHFTFQFNQIFQAENSFDFIKRQTQSFPVIFKTIKLQRITENITSAAIQAVYVIPTAQNIRIYPPGYQGS